MKRLTITAAAALLAVLAGCGTTTSPEPAVTTVTATTTETAPPITVTPAPAVQVPAACVDALAVADDMLDAWIDAAVHYEGAFINATESDGSRFRDLYTHAQASRADALDMLDTYQSAADECRRTVR